MGSSTITLRIVALLLLAHVCAGQLLIRFTNTETTVRNCGAIILEWRGGRAPYTLSVEENALLGTGATLQDLGSTAQNALRWNVALPADADNVRVVLTDSLGNTAIPPKAFRVAAALDPSCIPTGTPTGPTASLPSDSASVSQSASASASDSASTSQSSNPTSTSQSLPNTSTTPAPPLETKTTVTAVTTAPVPEATGANSATGAKTKEGPLPTAAIVGIVAGSLLAVIALALLIFCFVKRLRAKNDPLDGWDGAYDPESVLKATNQYNGASTMGPGGSVVPDTAPLWNPASTQAAYNATGAGQSPYDGIYASPPTNTAYGQSQGYPNQQYQYR